MLDQKGNSFITPQLDTNPIIIDTRGLTVEGFVNPTMLETPKKAEPKPIIDVGFSLSMLAIGLIILAVSTFLKFKYGK